MSVSAYLARRAAQKERVRILYRRALKDTLNWAVHRHLFYEDASNLRSRFEVNKDVEDLDTIDRIIADAEETYNKWRHPDPYIVPWAPGGSKFTRNPTPPPGMNISEEVPDAFLKRFLINTRTCITSSYKHASLWLYDLLKGKFPLKIEIVYDYGREDNN